MTTAKLYEKHIQGQVNKQAFLNEVRKDSNLPWVTNMTSYEDAIKILKNKGIISEGATMSHMQKGMGTPDREGAAYDYNAELDNTEYEELEEDEYNDKWTNATGIYKNRPVSVRGAGEGTLDLQYQDGRKELVNRVPEKEVGNLKKSKDNVQSLKSKDNDQSLNEAHELTTAQIIDRLNPYEFKRGVEYEMSKLKVLDNISYEKVKEKVAKKMQKDPLAYRYTQLANAKQIEKDDKRLAMTPVKKDNLVDKDNEMKRVKGFSEDKKNTSTPKTENRKGKPKGVKEMKGSKKKPTGVKDVMKHETQEKVLSEMVKFFKKKDSLKENDGSVSGMVPQQRTDMNPGSMVMTPDGEGKIVDKQGSVVTVEFLDENNTHTKEYTLNVLDKAREKADLDQAAKDKVERNKMWSDWDKKMQSGENPHMKPFTGPEAFVSKIDLQRQGLMEKIKKVIEKLKMRKETVFKDPKNLKAKPIVGSSPATKKALTQAGMVEIPGTEDAK